MHDNITATIIVSKEASSDTLYFSTHMIHTTWVLSLEHLSCLAQITGRLVLRVQLHVDLCSSLE